MGTNSNIEKTSNRQIARGAVISYIGIFLNIAVSLIYIPWMVSKIGQSNYGLYTLASSLISIFLVDFGLSSAAARFLAKYRAEGQQEKANQLMGIIYKLYVLIDCVILLVLIVVYFFIGTIYVGLTPEELAVFKLLYIIVAGFSIVSFPFITLSGIFNAYEKFTQLKLCDMCGRLLTVAFIILALIKGYGVVAVVAANAVSGLLMIIVKLFIIRRSTPVKADVKHRDKQLFKELFRFSIWITVIMLAQRCIFNLAPSILGIVASSKEIALFSPASALEGYFFTFAAALNGLFLPKISRYIASDNESGILPLMIKVGKYQFAVMGMFFVGFICIGRDFLILWMGPEYEVSFYCDALLFVPDILLFTQQIANTTATAKNEVRFQAVGYVLMGVICLGLSFVLAPRFGAIGSCLAICVSYLYLFVHMNFVYYRKLNIDVFVFFRKCYVGLLLPILAAGVIGYVISNCILTESSWGWLALKALIIMLIYLPLTFLLGMTSEDKKQLKEIISKKI